MSSNIKITKDEGLSHVLFQLRAQRLPIGRWEPHLEGQPMGFIADGVLEAGVSDTHEAGGGVLTLEGGASHEFSSEEF